MTYEELYDKHLKEVQKETPDVDVILDTTDEEVNWMKSSK